MFQRKFSKAEVVLFAGKFIGKTVIVVGVGVYLIGRGIDYTFRGLLWLTKRVIMQKN